MHRSLATCSRLCQRLSWSLRVTATASGFISIFCGRSRRTPSFVMPHADSIQGPSRVALRRVSVVPIPSGGRGYQWGIIIAILLVSSLQLGYMFMSGDRLGTAQPQSGPEIARAASPTRNDRLQQQHTDVKSTTGATKIKIGISKRRTEVLAPGDEGMQPPPTPCPSQHLYRRPDIFFQLLGSCSWPVLPRHCCM